MRQLKHHEKKLLKKVDFFSWKSEQNVREAKVIRKYFLQNREDYIKYNKIVGNVTKLCSKLQGLPSTDELRHQLSVQCLQKLYNMGIVNSTSSLSVIEKLSVSSFCRRRLPVVMVRLKMSETLKEATTFIEQGHVRVGPNVITDPAFLVTRTFEDYVTWVDSSKIKKTILRYNDKLDDYDLLGN
jgi:U3 small nucleolar ribonucleoprotein protein IMP3|mmetsp:Transcript_188/g.231  ORF Transcript_188/g.231 Transcript_188/m.231 type:complete len:184 (-) Transcript_188:245-796(-)